MAETLEEIRSSLASLLAEKGIKSTKKLKMNADFENEFKLHKDLKMGLKLDVFYAFSVSENISRVSIGITGPNKEKRNYVETMSNGKPNYLLSDGITMIDHPVDQDYIQSQFLEMGGRALQILNRN